VTNEPRTIIRTAVEQGMHGPIAMGVARISRVTTGGAAIQRTFNPPRSDLLDTDWDSMSDADIAAISLSTDG
jgi:hypothetical protein